MGDSFIIPDEVDEQSTSSSFIIPDEVELESKPVLETPSYGLVGAGWPTGGKYSPEQKAALDAGRASLLKEEYDKAKNFGDIETQLQLGKEIDIFNSKTQGKFTNVSTTSSSYIIPDEVEPATSSPRTAHGTPPDTRNYVLNKITQGLAAIPAGGFDVLGYISNKIDPAGEFGNPYNAVAKELREASAKSWGITPEMEENATFGQKALGMGAQMLTQLPLYFTPVGAALAVTLPSISQGSALSEQGIDDKTAFQTTLMSIGGAALTWKIATVFPGGGMSQYLKSAAATGGVNAAQEAGVAFSTHELLKEKYPELADKYKWNDLENIALNLVVGAPMGAGMKFVHDASGRRINTITREKTKELYDNLISNGIVNVDNVVPKALDMHSWKYRFDEAKDPNKALSLVENNHTVSESLVDDTPTRRQTDLNSGLTILNYLDGLLRTDVVNQQDNAIYHTMLSTLKHLGAENGLGDVNVVFHDGNRGSGVYDSVSNAIIIPRHDSPHAIPHTIHEVVHALTSKRFAKFESILDGTNPRPTDINELASLAKYENLKKGFEQFRDETGKLVSDKLKVNFPDFWRSLTLKGQDPLTGLNNIRSIDPNTGKIVDWEAFNDQMVRFQQITGKRLDPYGFKNIDEFISVLFETGLHKNDPHKIEEYGENIKNWSGDKWSPTKPSALTALFKQAKDLFDDQSSGLFWKNTSDQIFSFLDAEGKGKVDLTELNNLARAQSAYDRGLILEIDKVLTEASSVKEAKANLEAISDSAAWKTYINFNFDRLYASGHRFNAMATKIKESIAKEVGTNVGDQMTQVKSLSDLMKAVNLIGAKDLDIPFNSKFLGPDQIKLLKNQGPLGKVLRWYFGEQQRYNQLEAKLFANISQHMLAYKTLSSKDQRATMHFASLVDGDTTLRSMLTQAKMFWPDKAMIDTIAQQRGLKLTEASKLAYLDMGNAMTRTYDLLDAVRLIKGEEPILRIPGYMPRVWRGAYKVHVERNFNTTNDPRNDKWRTVEVRGFNFRQSAEKFAKAIDGSGNAQFRIVKNNKGIYAGKSWHVAELRDMDAGLIPALMQDIEAYRAFTLLDPAGQSFLSKIDSQHIEGYNSHLEDRTGVHGFLGESNSPYPKGYSKFDILAGQRRRDTDAFLNLFEDYAKGVVETYKNVTFNKNVYEKMFGQTADPIMDKREFHANTFASFPKFVKYVNEQTANFMGTALNRFVDVDDIFSRASVKVGLPPYFYRQTAKAIRNAMSIVFTRYNPGNWVMNAIQPMHSTSILSFIDSMRRQEGKTHANVEGVLLDWSRGMKNGNQDLYHALAWARENHILEAQQEYQVRSKEAKTRLGKIREKVDLNWVPTTIEGQARETAFGISYMYFKKVLGDPVLAREEAREAMGTIMVNYDRSKRPLMFQSYGVVGELLSPFAVYRNAYVGNTLMMVKHALSNPKQFHAWKPFLMANAMYMFSAGLIGSIGVSEYDALLRLLKQYAPETFGDWPDAYTQMREVGIPQVMRVGLLTSATKAVPGFHEGVQIGGSGSAVGLDDVLDPNIAPFLTAIASLVKVGSKVVTGQDITSRDLYESAGSVLPPQIKHAIERNIQEKDFQTGLSGSLAGAADRDPVDNLTRSIWGKASIKEFEELGEIRQAKAVQEKHNAEIKKLVTLAVESLNGNNNLDFDILEYRAVELGTSQQEFMEMVFNKKLERAVPFLDKLSTQKDSLLKNKVLDQLYDIRRN